MDTLERREARDVFIPLDPNCQNLASYSTLTHSITSLKAQMIYTAFSTYAVVLPNTRELTLMC